MPTASSYVGGLCCSKIAEAEVVVSVNEKKWLVMYVHVHLLLGCVEHMRCTLSDVANRSLLACVGGHVLERAQNWACSVDEIDLLCVVVLCCPANAGLNISIQCSLSG